MTVEDFASSLKQLISTAELMLNSSQGGKREENTKDKLITPLLNQLGYTEKYRTLEGNIPSLIGTTTWVDYLLIPDENKHPYLMFEAKHLWDKNLWQKYGQQILDYIRNYSLDIGTDKPILWIILSNFKEWHILRLQDKKPFWSFTIEDLKNDPELVQNFYNCLCRENIKSDRLSAFYPEKTREELGIKFLADLKIWRVILANGIKKSQPHLTLAEIREYAQVILNRFLLIRLLETFSREMPFNYLGKVYDNWQQNFPNLPFIEDLRRAFHHTWVGYNTDLFQFSSVDQLMIEVEYLEPIIVLNTLPKEGILYEITSTISEYRSIYNYDFTTLTQDILGTAYEQFLAHQLVIENDVIKVLENQETRKQEGIFYTPDYIVKRIVYQTLQPLIKPKIDEAINLLNQEKFTEASEIANSVFDITILDPACGSGSFLLGAFDYLLTEIKRYNDACGKVKIPKTNDIFQHIPPQAITNLEEKIIVKMLHGVDRDPQAVLLAKLSLWTKLLRIRPGEYGSRNGSIYSHLPALTLNIRVGDSLIFSPYNFDSIKDKLAIISDLTKKAKNTELTEIERNKAVTDFQHQANLINQEINPILTAFFASDESITSVINSLKNRQPLDKEIDNIRDYLTEDKKTTKLKENWTDNELIKLKSELTIIESAKEDIITKRPFNWVVEFPHIFDLHLPKNQQGFTAIIGNPPYFNVDATFGRGALELKWLKSVYDDIYTDKTDILFYFFRQGFNLLKSEGKLSFIVSRAFLQGDKSAKLREFLGKNTRIESILDFLGYQVFKAGIATCILSFTKDNYNRNNHSFTVDNVINFDDIKSVLNSDNPLNNFPENSIISVNIQQSSLDSSRWEISPFNDIFQHIDLNCTKLTNLDCGKLMKGIDTGLDSVFEGLFEGIFPAEFLKSRLAISTINSFGYEPQNTQIIYYTHDTVWEDLPILLQNYLTANRQLLESRKSYQSAGYDWFHLHRDRVGLFNPKIIFPRRANSNKFMVDERGNLGFKSDVAGYILQDSFSVDLLYLICALLNSQVLEFRYRALGGLGKLTGKGMFEYFENQVGDLPIPNLTNWQNNQDYQKLINLSKEAHQIWQLRYQIITTYQQKSTAIIAEEIPLKEYLAITGDYALDIEWESKIAKKEGYLLNLKILPNYQGFILAGEITEAEDWKQGDKEYLTIANIKVNNDTLLRYLLAKVIYIIEFDNSFRRKQKLASQREKLIKTAFDVLKVNRYDEDKVKNLRALEVIESRVKNEVGKSDLENILHRQQTIKTEIDNLAYKIYQVEEYRGIIEQSL